MCQLLLFFDALVGEVNERINFSLGNGSISNQMPDVLLFPCFYYFELVISERTLVNVIGSCNVFYLSILVFCFSGLSVFVVNRIVSGEQSLDVIDIFL